MAIRCAQCREASPDDAAFCIRCGALLRPATAPPHALAPAASGTTMHLRSSALNFKPPRSAMPGPRAALIGTVALGFAFAEIIGFAEFVAQSGWNGWAVWAALLLAGGALIAEHDWLNGALRRGLYGMLCWGLLPWLLAAQRDLAWLVLPALGWWLIWLRDRP